MWKCLKPFCNGHTSIFYVKPILATLIDNSWPDAIKNNDLLLF